MNNQANMQIAKGMFALDTPDGPSVQREPFESFIVAALLATEPESATERLDAILERSREPLPGEGVNLVSERLVYLRSVGAAVDSAGQKAYADLVRSHLKPEEQADVVGTPVGSVTGHFLGLVSIQQGQMSFAEAAASALAYYDASRNDKILVEFLKNSDSRSDSNRVLARVIANKISDEEARTAIVQDLE